MGNEMGYEMSNKEFTGPQCAECVDYPEGTIDFINEVYKFCERGALKSVVSATESELHRKYLVNNKIFNKQTCLQAAAKRDSVDIVMHLYNQFASSPDVVKEDLKVDVTNSLKVAVDNSSWKTIKFLLIKIISAGDEYAGYNYGLIT